MFHRRDRAISPRLTDHALDQPVHLPQLREREDLAGLHPFDAFVVTDRALEPSRLAAAELAGIRLVSASRSAAAASS